MSIVKNIEQQIQDILHKQLTSDDMNLQLIETQLLSIVPTLNPALIFLTNNQIQSELPEMVYMSLTVQDILDTEFYYAYLISKPIAKNSQVYILKYGLSYSIQQNIDLENYHGVIDSRDTLVCVRDFYASKWVLEQRKGKDSIQQYIPVKISGNNCYKLGQKIYAVCVWSPQDKYLTFVRAATQQQIQKQRLNYEEISLKQQINFVEARQALQQNLKMFCSEVQALMVMLCMISQEPMFINSHDISEQLSQLLPRVNHLKIKAPFKQSLFPYKNSEGRLIQTPMQMSMDRTFVIIDFSEFSQQKQIKVNHEEINNIKALKVFVEEGKTVYRWEFGESLNEHGHSGVIVKGSKIINPHFYIQQQFVDKQKSRINPFKQMCEQKKQLLRTYIQKCILLKPSLSDKSRTEIENEIGLDLKKNPQKQLQIQEMMKLAKLHAKSYGKKYIEVQDYFVAKKLMGESVTK